MATLRITTAPSRISPPTSVPGAAQLLEIHDDIQQRTNAIADFFEGQAATGFHEAQMQMLHGLQGLIQTVSRHCQTISSVNEGAHATDLSMSNLF